MSGMYIFNEPLRIEAKTKENSKRDLSECYDKLKKMAKKGLISVTEYHETQKDYIKFGKWDYGIEENPNKEDIEWEVLEYSEDKKRALVLSRYILDVRQYHSDYRNSDVVWGNSSIRKWLNGTFYNTAFSEDEKKLIKKTHLNFEDSSNERSYEDIVAWYNYRNYIDETKDKIFLLSIDDLFKYFWNQDTYFKDDVNTLLRSDDQNIDRVATLRYGEAESWYLRNIGTYHDYHEDDDNYDIIYLACNVLEDGALSCDGTIHESYAVNKASGIRPAMWIELTQKMIEENKLSIGGYNKDKKKLNVLMGNYKFTDSKGNISKEKTEIEWEVIDYDKKNNKALLISKYILCNKPYDSQNSMVTWADCSLRKWLNTKFYRKTFTQREKNLICKVKNQNKCCQECDEKKDGKDTKDKIFLLSESEIEDLYGYNNQIFNYFVYDLKCTYIDGKVTSQMAHGIDEVYPKWWLRTHINKEDDHFTDPPVMAIKGGTVAYHIYYDISDIPEDFDSMPVENKMEYMGYKGVRPAMWISLE